jgi:hypothetical protein
MDFQKRITYLLIMCFYSLVIHAQDSNLLNMLDSIAPQKVQYTYGTFKSTRVINGHSNERMPEGQLDVRIEHRFGFINQGYSTFFGLDQANTFIALEYGIKDWVMVGLNRASVDKTVSGFAKFSILRQSTGKIQMPVSVSALVETSVEGNDILPGQTNLFSSRVTYTSQLIISRKINENISLQFSPVWIHRNLVPTTVDRNDMFALGFASRYKISRRTSFNIEYYPVISPSWDHQNSYQNSLSLGFDIETGGHVFQFMITNTSGMIEKAFVTETTGKWLNGDLRLGFNISRVFSFKKIKH